MNELDISNTTQLRLQHVKEVRDAWMNELTKTNASREIYIDVLWRNLQQIAETGNEEALIEALDAANF